MPKIFEHAIKRWQILVRVTREVASMAINKKSITQEEFFHADPSPGDIGTSGQANAPYYASPYLLLAAF